jgi:DNA polymerase-1
MNHITFGNSIYDTAILIKSAALNQVNLQENYLDPLVQMGYDTSYMVAFDLTYDKKKPSAACRKEYLAELLPALDTLGIHYLICADSEYFKTITKNKTAEPHVGYILPCAIEGFEHINVCYAQNYQSYFYNPDTAAKTMLSLEALVSHSKDDYEELGKNVLKDLNLPQSTGAIADWLQKLLLYPALTIDIEAYSLKHHDAGIGTISFSWDEHSAVVFPVDSQACSPYTIDVWDKKDKKFKQKIAHNRQVPNKEVRTLLKEFFETYTGKTIWHNLSYDGVVLTYQLWMDSLIDREGLAIGRDVMLKNAECSQIITYLATNSCAGNELGLKAQAHEFVGNYAIDVKDIRLQTLPDLLKYNAVDTCATWFVYNKNLKKMIHDKQEDIYINTFKPCLYDIFEMHLTGMCLDIPRVKVVQTELGIIRSNSYKTVLGEEITQQFIQASKETEVVDRNEAYKKKVIDITEAKFELNLNSGPQLQRLLYDWMSLPVLDTTPTKQPATGGDTLKKLIHHTENPSYKKIIQAILEFVEVEKILSSFITAFLRDSVMCPDGSVRIFGSFKLGGTLSGRLSSSNPNIQQMPSGSTFGKLIKSCFIAPPNMVFGMSDFAGLEDVINTLLTQDPNKEKVLLDGFDGHSFRALSFWPEKFPNIDPSDPKSVNSIAKTHKGIRSDAKPVHFALQYLGTWSTLMNNCGFSADESKVIEARYKDLYKVSFDWVNDRIQEASNIGYATSAFGLRIRSPLLHQVVLGNRKTPQEAQAESRSLGNAVSGQSFGLLNGRASAEFMQRVRASEYVYDIHLCAQIHDAIYLYWTPSIEITLWVNTNLIECMAWSDLPELQHDRIKLSSELDIAYPTWADTVTIPNGANEETLINVLKQERINRCS